MSDKIQMKLEFRQQVRERDFEVFNVALVR